MKELFMKDFNGEKIFSLEYDKETLKDMVLEKQEEIERLNSILNTLEQDMVLLNATGIKEIKPKYVFDRILMLREVVDKE